MKRILVISDSHGNRNFFLRAVQEEMPDMILFLGDGLGDAKKVANKFPKIPMRCVRGNCDFDSNVPAEDVLETEGHRIFFTHGNRYNVKSEYTTIAAAAKEKGADAVLFGHTHRLYYTYHNGLAILNPGSIGNPPYKIPASAGVLIVKEGGPVKIETRFYK